MQRTLVMWELFSRLRSSMLFGIPLHMLISVLGILSTLYLLCTVNTHVQEAFPTSFPVGKCHPLHSEAALACYCHCADPTIFLLFSRCFPSKFCAPIDGQYIL